jgi:hypothetical protein
MNKTSVLHAPSYAHQGEFLASGTVWNFAACVETTHDVTSSEAVEYVHNVRKLIQVSTQADAQDGTALMYMGYKWPTEDDYHERNGLYADRVTDGEGIIGLQMMPGVRIQEYTGTDYTTGGPGADADVKLGALAPIDWTAVTYGAKLYLTDSGQFTTASTNLICRAQFVEMKGTWVILEMVQPFNINNV